MDLPVILMLITDHSKHLRHGVVEMFNATVYARAVGAGRDFMYVKEFIYGGCELGANLRSVIRKAGGRSTQEKDVAIHQDVDSAVCGEFGCGDSEHVRTAAERIRKEEDVRISSGRCRQRPKVVDTDRDTKAVGQRYREGWPRNCLAGGEATAHPPFCVEFHTNPPVKTLQHFKGASNIEMTGGIGMVCMHYLWSG